MDVFFGTLFNREFAERPLTLVDVGARGGLQPNWRRAAKHLRVVGFEPDPEEFARLSARGGPLRLYVNAALDREPGERLLNLCRSPGVSSLIEPNRDFLHRFPDAQRFDVIGRVLVRTDTLDRALAAANVSDPDFLKLDTQGSELAILEGGLRTIEHAIFGVELEIQFAPLYHGQPRFGDLDALLADAGFQLMDLRPCFWKRARGACYGGPKGQLVFADALYFKTESAFERLLEARTDPEEKRSKLLRALSICLLYGYKDYALELFVSNETLLEAPQAHGVLRELRSGVPLHARIPHFRGRGWLSHLFYRLHRLFYPTVGGWASGERHLGNLE